MLVLACDEGSLRGGSNVTEVSTTVSFCERFGGGSGGSDCVEVMMDVRVIMCLSFVVSSVRTANMLRVGSCASTIPVSVGWEKVRDVTGWSSACSASHVT